MKKYSFFITGLLCAALLLCVSCKPKIDPALNGEETISSQSESESESESASSEQPLADGEASQSGTPLEQECQEIEPPAIPPENMEVPEGFIAFRVIDRFGKPVAGIGGGIEHTEGERVVSSPFNSKDGVWLVTGEDGILLLDLDLYKMPEAGQYTLVLVAANDSSRVQVAEIEYSRAQKQYDILWEHPHPGNQSALAATELWIRVVDLKGNPVKNISAGLVYSDGESESYFPIQSEGGALLVTGEDGILLWDLSYYGELPPPGKCTLMLYDTMDQSVSQQVSMIILDQPAAYDVIWEHPHPGNQSAPLTSGLLIRIIDSKGKPVEGIEFSGSPYPKEKLGDIPDIAVILGPSDKNGQIRWAGPLEKGTYELYGFKDEGAGEPYVLKYTGKEALETITLTWIDR